MNVAGNQIFADTALSRDEDFLVHHGESGGHRHHALHRPADTEDVRHRRAAGSTNRHIEGGASARQASGRWDIEMYI